MVDIIQQAISQGAKLYASISGGKDGQAMTKILMQNGIPIEGLIHADLGRMEWSQSMDMCNKLAAEFSIPLYVVRRSDGADLLEHMQNRMQKLKGQNKPFWPSSSTRYCTSDTKRDPIDKFLRNCGHDLVISCEGIRAEESTARSKKSPLEIRSRISAKCYEGMTAEEALANFQPGHRLALTWYPILNMSLEEVWQTYGMSCELLEKARLEYKATGLDPVWWPFHPAYPYGNDRVSCVFCVLGSLNDLQVGAQHRPELLSELIGMQEESGYTFKHKWSLENLNQ